MNKARIEAFTDAVIAIIMTILVLELKQPKQATWRAIFTNWHAYLSYLISFAICAITWNNHHHMFQIVKRVNGKILWANNLQILVLSFYPYLTVFVANHFYSPVPEMCYGIGFLLGNLAYFNLSRILIKSDPGNEKMKSVLTLNGRFIGSFTILLIGIAGSYLFPVLNVICCIITLAIWADPLPAVEKLFN